MDDRGVKRRKANSGDAAGKGGEKPQKPARRKNTMSRMKSGEGLNKPKTVSGKTPAIYPRLAGR
jgi:hypothetical protein